MPKRKIKKEVIENKTLSLPEEIHDPAEVFKLAYLDMRLSDAMSRKAFIEKDFDQKIVMLDLDYKNKRSTLLTQRQHQLNNVRAEIDDAQKNVKEQKDYIEKKHGIALRAYTYDDLTGTLRLQEILEKEEVPEEKQNSLESEKPKDISHLN